MPLSRLLQRAKMVLFAAVLSFSPVVAPAQSAEAQAAFQAGVQAFKQNNYSAARSHFLRARRAGLDTPALRYNLGATYYRLGQYGASRREFEQLVDLDVWAALGHYNLGLIANRQGRFGEAARHFRIAERQARDPQLRRLAASAQARVPAPQPWSSLISFAVGSDDNVTLSDEPSLLGVTDQEDVFFDFLAATRGYLSGNRNDGVRLDGGVFLKEFADTEPFDETDFRLGIFRDRRAQGWLTSIGGHIDVLFLDKEHFENVYSFDVGGLHRLDTGPTVHLRNRLSYMQPGEDFDELEGWRNRVDLWLHLPVEAARFRAGYQYEFNDREDLTSSGEFFSRSPHRHSFSLQYRGPLGPRWTLTARGEYRISEYRDPDRIDTGGGSFIERTREEDRLDFVARADWNAFRPWIVFGEYRFTDNDANFDDFDYTRNVIRIGIERLF